MFTLFQRNKQVDLSPYVRRICDLTVPNLLVGEETRTDKRYVRVIPVVVCPWLGEDGPDLNEAIIALTRDLSDRGVGLIHSENIQHEQLVLGFWMSREEMAEPWYFQTRLEITRPLGGGYWAIGLQLEEFLNTDHRRVLEPLNEIAEQLLPPIHCPTAD